MRVIFTLSPEDLLALEEYQIKKAQGLTGNQRLGLILAVAVIASLLGFLSPGDPGPRQEDTLLTLGSIVLPVAVVAICFWVARRYSARRLRNLDREIPGVYEPRTLGLEPEYLVAEDATGEGKTRWTAVKDVTQTPERIFILLAGNSGHVVPRRAFASADEANRFAETATAYWRAGSGKPH